MPYRVCFEASGPTALWTRPDTGDAPVSYPAPTYAAVKGIFESTEKRGRVSYFSIEWN
jgi:CRISPR-associated protein Cas5d